jgi:hypothetical protein
MPIWPWNAAIRPKLCGCSAPASSSSIRANAIACRAVKGSGRRAQRFGQHHRARTRPAAAVRRGEGLVQVDVHGIDAKVAGTHLADDGVEIGAVAIDIAARRMDRVGDRLHVALEQAAGVGIGDHHPRDIRPEPRLSARPDRRALGVAGMFST